MVSLASNVAAKAATHKARSCVEAQCNAANGEVLEINPSGHRLMFELGARLAKQGGAALLIDYGHTVTRFGETLQALRAHRYVDPLVAPGECDLTAHVDFAAMAEAEPVIIRAAKKNVVHRNAARRKVSRLAHRIAKLGKA